MKKFFALLLCLSVMTVATACGSKEEPAPQDTESQVEETVEESTADDAITEDADIAETEEMTEDAAEDAEAAEATFTGMLEEKKDFMVVVSAEDQSYTFTLADGVTCDAEVGAEITVTYTGDLEAPEADQNLTATQIVAAQ